MKFVKQFSFIYTAAYIFIAAVSMSAQTPRQDFNRPQTFDAQHYKLKLSFDHADKRVFGETTISLKPLKAGFRVVELDQAGIKFDGAWLEPDDKSLDLRTSASKVLVTLDRAYGPDETVTIRLKHNAKPSKGVYFVSRSGDRSEQIWTQGEPDESRHWFPSFDFPSDKATTEQVITAEKGFTVIGNGELISRTENSDNTETWHFKMPVPHSVYLISFVVGKYVHIQEKYRDIPLNYYIYPGREQTAKNAYGGTIAMMELFEELTGVPYPYNKYDQTVVAEFHFGGMENITATTMADTFIFLADSSFGKTQVTDLVSHELAHSWFGNLVTCRNWAELWLNEGYATYFEAIYREKAYGRQNYMSKVRSDAAQFLIDDAVTRRRHGLFNHRAGDVSTLFDNPSVTYNKGGVVLHMLRELIGTEAFWKGTNIYLTRHKFGSVETPDLRRAMEEAAKTDLGWFFDQWVYGASHPRLDVRQTYNQRTKRLTLTVTQTQRPDQIVPAVFRLPMDLEISTANDTRTEKIEINKRVQSFNFEVDSRPTEIAFDPSEQIPLKSVRQRALVNLR